MLEVNELTYAAIITIELPGMRHPATISLTLTPPDVIEVAEGEFKALRDCTLNDLQAFAESMEEALWEEHRHQTIAELADDELPAIKITLLSEGGKAVAMSRDQVLQHAIRVGVANTRQAAPPAPDLAHEEAEIATSQEDEQPAIVEETEAAPESGEDLAPEEALDEAEETSTAELPAEATEEAPVVDGAPETAALDSGDADLAEAPPLIPAREKSLRIAGLRRPLGHPTRSAVDILVNEAAMRDAQAHALSSMDREVAGMLIGPRPEKQPDGRYVVHVTDAIIARHTRMMGASVTYTPESWRYVTDKLQEMYPNEEAIIVGWYHTHPGFGIFLSGMDLFIHQNFFTQLWHIALVLDPRAARMGFFSWDRRKREVMPYDFPWPEWAPYAW